MKLELIQDSTVYTRAGPDYTPLLCSLLMEHHALLQHTAAHQPSQHLEIEKE